MTPAELDRARQALEDAVRPTAQCLPTERLGDVHTPDELEHINECARCQAEVALWEAFSGVATPAAEKAAVEWVVADVRRRRVAQISSGWRRTAWTAAAASGIMRPARLLAAVATVFLAVSVGYVAWNRERRALNPQPPGQVYRDAGLSTIAPIGDVRAAPTELAWKGIDAADRYEVLVLEVDGTILWRGSAAVSRIALPRSLIAQIVPGKTVVWKVSALNGSGTVIAVSATQKFRVTVGS